MKKNLFFGIGLVCSFLFASNAEMRRAVTYEQSHGRFGDNLLSYIHAKWISYKYDIPLLYKPFIYSDQLKLHQQELLYTYELKAQFDTTVVLGKERSVSLNDQSSILYFVPYFPESKWERSVGVSFSGGVWDYFEIDWTDKGFINELREVIAPCQSIAMMDLPKDKITVALHMRTGGNHDTSDVPACFPLKFLPKEFYISQIRRLYEIVHAKSLYVYLFTDDNNPLGIIDVFKASLCDIDVQFDCRREGNADTANVIEDFFALQQFDCLIHSESNFSFIMSKIGNYMVAIYPDSFHKDSNDGIVYDNIKCMSNLVS